MTRSLLRKASSAAGKGAGGGRWLAAVAVLVGVAVGVIDAYIALGLIYESARAVFPLPSGLLQWLVVGVALLCAHLAAWTLLARAQRRMRGSGWPGLGTIVLSAVLTAITGSEVNLAGSGHRGSDDEGSAPPS